MIDKTDPSQRDRQRDPAFAKFMAIQLIRVSGVALFIFGVLAASGKAPWPDGLPAEWAWALALIGAGDAFFMPTFLARMWSTNNK
ncbi:hypothetical protein [Croceicoccus naphthovorans]|uniref:Uncharacterized protein n=1 Tax=Croceicoccus naphthovorans TaxID=1348774 RepID=A0A0G3XHY7_9SPHN|nr:hypothetical protein [Croceicoccus naphthovorans]AKM10812.1 hypothetical protein AB433_13895 [Croceicoccus naphthovorans]MBB3989020.1 hypothetical protein [Croceicoccus naphthovorans]